MSAAGAEEEQGEACQQGDHAAQEEVGKALDLLVDLGVELGADLVDLGADLVDARVGLADFRLELGRAWPGSPPAAPGGIPAARRACVPAAR